LSGISLQIFCGAVMAQVVPASENIEASLVSVLQTPDVLAPGSQETLSVMKLQLDELQQKNKDLTEAASLEQSTLKHEAEALVAKAAILQKQLEDTLQTTKNSAEVLVALKEKMTLTEGENEALRQNLNLANEEVLTLREQKDGTNVVTDLKAQLAKQESDAIKKLKDEKPVYHASTSERN
jgi:hypothetical protein